MSIKFTPTLIGYVGLPTVTQDAMGLPVSLLQPIVNLCGSVYAYTKLTLHVYLRLTASLRHAGFGTIVQMVVAARLKLRSVFRIENNGGQETIMMSVIYEIIKELPLSLRKWVES